MPLDALFDAAQVLGSVAVGVSLIYVALQLRQAAAQFVRSDANATHAQHSAIRMAIVSDPEVARIWRAVLEDHGLPDPIDDLRAETLIAEHVWASFHVWDRTRHGLSKSLQWRRSMADDAARLIRTRRGSDWWDRVRSRFPEDFAEDLEPVARWVRVGAGPTVEPSAALPRLTAAT